VAAAVTAAVLVVVEVAERTGATFGTAFAVCWGGEAAPSCWSLPLHSRAVCA
jgi:hypothetical protein